MSGAEKITVRVTEKTELNDLVTRFRFEPVDGGLLPTFSGGAHTVVEMQDDAITRLNPYSLMSDPFDQSAYTISVRRDDEGRGGSLFLHKNVNVGDEMVISNPVNLFSLDLRAKKHLMIAGGIGITPFLAQIKQLDRAHGNWELHYACRSEALGSYVDYLTTTHPNDVNVYYDDQGQAIDLETLFDGQPLGTHIYVCGPKGMIDWVRSKAADLGWPREAVHYEEFLAPQPGKPFEVKLAVSNKVVQVGEQESLLEAMERVGVDAPYLCRGGACGMCETRVIDYTGNFIHRDHWLEDEEHSSGEKIMPCVSRFEGKTLVLDR
ncbi:Phthalate 4,5-dioxygenase oxygenase reductase subunit [Ascidiaceihabitans donghaensis]|uniref:Phthalate 4,5-dioxygenase oxygenase reductase subunit n=1 Tax=Ascidiaceihabitans donghaensis TaxID=1510460 RepID=A0A2R8B9I3_9RHOB|nr:PDR/VanB family oxidoreductase [Ascidiaceihabitans donghaensis]SPH19697.1 Phthalate 4,5-dioxygenase oxygenase reductase subunit [Ascidiaceihabitans donghaensis]